MRVQTSRARGARRGGALTTAIVSGLLVICLVTIASGTILLFSGHDKGAEASRVQPQPGALRWDPYTRLTCLSIIVNADSPAGATAESLVVWSFHPNSRVLNLLSIPTDLWVTIPGFGAGRIADAYADGGAPLALLTVESALRAPIPYYWVTGTTGFRQVVDALGGISVRVPSEEAGRRVSGITLVSGRQHMDGATALSYARMAMPWGEGQVGEMLRTQRVLLAEMHAGASPSVQLRFSSILSDLGRSISTNISFDQISSLARGVGSVPRSGIHTEELSFGTQAVTRYRETLLLPNWQRIGEIAHSLFPFQGAPDSVDVLNGTGLIGQASAVASWLRGAGVPVGGTGSTPSYGYAHTHVLLRVGAGRVARLTAQEVAALLQVPVRTGSLRGSTAPVQLIVGADYQDLSQQ